MCVDYEIWIPHPGSHEVMVKEHFHLFYHSYVITVFKDLSNYNYRPVLEEV
jgi:hypothetical protein